LRLAHIKLAGFKSFVDPTHIPVPNSLVGVVGPNGCGKSNVIDAVRWVLGESSAKHLRGETMQDVIFNGSSQRKPVSRASVELIFDNSLGRAGGAWSRYAEISVKRVLERNGESSYFINNQHVRRRDVADMFLGTGLGGRAYAIIEQGMISRIIEARPEDMRNFLEEAAGISKYRERRKETEDRLSDTRENLARVGDILQELTRNLERLEGQAEVAARFRNLEAELKNTQHLLWFMRRQEAAQQRKRHANELESVGVELEALIAKLRQLESQLETARQAYHDASDQLQRAQGGLYEANSAVARLEQNLEYLRQNRKRLQAQLQDSETELTQAQSRRATIESSLADQRLAVDAAQREVTIAQGRAEDAAGALPAAEQAQAGSRQHLDESQQQVARVQRELGVERTRVSHTERALEQLEARRSRLRQERDGVQRPDPREVADLKARLEASNETLLTARDAVSVVDGRVSPLEQALKAATQESETVQRELGVLDARHQALDLLQRRVSRSGEMHAWLDQRQLDSLYRLWQGLSIRPGWENALEAVLRERLNGIALADLVQAEAWLQQPPPGKVSFFERRARERQAGSWNGRALLLDCVEVRDSTLGAILADWLDQIYMVDSAAEGFRIRADLPPGARLVCPEGHVFTAVSVSFHAEDSEVHGILARQHEIEELQRRRVQLTQRAQTGARQVELAQEALSACRAELQAARECRDEAQRVRHTEELAFVRGSEQADRLNQRVDQLDADLASIDAENAREHAIRHDAEQAVTRLSEQEVVAESQLEAARQSHEAAAERLKVAQETHQGAVAQLREREFGERVVRQKIIDLDAALQQVAAGLDRLSGLRDSARAELATLDEASLDASLQQALALQAEREGTLAQCRAAVEEKDGAQRDLDSGRMNAQQGIGPLTERQGELRLKEQEARLAEENYATQLTEAGAVEEELATRLVKGVRANALQADIARLSEEIQSLGAVNLAALEELETARTRKNYLEAQDRDLNEAIATLEDAIRKIDRETRERLRHTFDEVNRHFGEMFPQLFGGGEARLEMTGEEILDCGVQVIARPPGKRNTSIHLLSGGEKALTAVALVFSLFQLNPAPFCLLDEVDAPLDDSNTVRFCRLVQRMAEQTQFLYISHNKIAMEMAQQLIGVTMAEQGVSRIVAVDVDEAVRMRSEVAA